MLAQSPRERGRAGPTGRRDGRPSGKAWPAPAPRAVRSCALLGASRRRWRSEGFLRRGEAGGIALEQHFAADAVQFCFECAIAQVIRGRPAPRRGWRRRGPTGPLHDFAEANLPALIDLWAAAWTATGIPIDFDARRAGSTIAFALPPPRSSSASTRAGSPPAPSRSIRNPAISASSSSRQPSAAGLAVASIRRDHRLFEGTGCDHLPS